MPAGRVLATQQARDAANQLLALTGPVKEQVRRVLQHGGVLADPNHWDSSLAGTWRNDWGPDANQLNQAAAKLDELEHRAHQVVEDIFKADDASPGAPGPVPQTEELVPEGGFDAGDVAILVADLAGIVDPTPISDGISGVMSLFKGDWGGAGLSAASMIPYAGDALAKPAKVLKAFIKQFPALKRIGKIEDIFNALRIENFEDLLAALKNPQRLKGINDTLATLNRVHRDAEKVYENSRWLQKAKDLGLPADGPVVFVPPKNWDPSNPFRELPQKGKLGYVDRYGNVWSKGPGRGGDDFEWDVQRPKDKPNTPSPLVDRLSGDGKHVNVGTNGRITHG